MTQKKKITTLIFFSVCVNNQQDKILTSAELTDDYKVEITEN